MSEAPPTPQEPPAEPVQQELPLAIVQGMTLTEMPQDLYIPPDALRVFLETFEGPLDLLLYLIRKQNLDILDIPITQITTQYLQYINLMQDLQLELAAEYLVMAALLLEIKSRMLLPRQEVEGEEDEEEADPRTRLVQQLQDYARFKQAAEDLNALPLVGRDTFMLDVHMPQVQQAKIPPKVPLEEVISAMRDVLVRLELFTAHHIAREPLSVRERMSMVLEMLGREHKLLYQALFTQEEGRQGAVVAFIAILELAKELLLEMEQEQMFGPIEVREKENGGMEQSPFVEERAKLSEA